MTLHKLLQLFIFIWLFSVLVGYTYGQQDVRTISEISFEEELVKIDSIFSSEGFDAAFEYLQSLLELYNDDKKKKTIIKQRMGYTLEVQRKHKDAVSLYSSLHNEIDNNNLEIPDSIRGEICLGLGRAWTYIHLDSSIFYSKCAVSFFGENNIAAARAFTEIGFVNSFKEEYDSLNYYYQLAENLLLKSEGYNSKNLAFLYQRRGISLKRMGDLNKAILDFDRSLNLLEKNDNRIVHIKRSLALTHIENENYKKALKILESINENALLKNAFEQAVIEENIGRCKLSLGNPNDAISHFEKAFFFKQKTQYFKKEHEAFFLFYLGECYHKKQEYELAKIKYYKALDIIKGKDGYVELMTNIYFSLGTNIITQNNKTKGLHFFSKALVIQGIDTLNWSIDNKFYSRQSKVLNILSQYAQVINSDIDEINIKEKYLGIALKGISIIKRMERNLSNNSKLDLKGLGTPIFELGINASYSLFEKTKNEIYLNKAFQISEMSKYSLLLENLRNDKAKIFSGIRKELLKKENSLQTTLAYHENKLRIEELGENETDKIKILKEKVFIAQQSYDVLLQTIKSESPDYFKLKYDDITATIEELQKLIITESTSILEYFIGENDIFVFSIGKENASIFKMDKPGLLEKKVEDLRQGIYSYHLDKSRSLSKKETSNILIKNAHQLYNDIFAPIESKIKLPQKIIIIPDGILGYIPFDVLLKKIPKKHDYFNNHEYLISNFQISYAYSATLLIEMQRKEIQKTKEQFIAFAPSFDGEVSINKTIDEVRNELGRLEHNLLEVETIQGIIGGKIFHDSMATKKAFIAKAPNSKIIHLSTHGKANDKIGDHSYLAFSKTSDDSNYDFVYNRELYHLKLNAEMVVLSACETGIGELQKGEGIISLARGFSYAGAKSMITSLWSVNDKKTSELMALFYRYIKEGKTKDEALRQAKLDFIKTHKVDAHPFYWAAFIPIGDMGAIELSNEINWWLWGGGIFMLIGTFIFFRKNRN